MKESTRDTNSDSSSQTPFDPSQITTGRVLAELPGFLTGQQASWFDSLEPKWQAEIIAGAKTDGLAITIKHIKWLFKHALRMMFDVPPKVLLDQTPGPEEEEEKPLREWLDDLDDYKARTAPGRMERHDHEPTPDVQAVLDHSFPDPATEAAKRDLQAQMDKIKRRSAK